ncbi:MAG: phage major capsid protein [Actinobacteria bacterium]|nr:phage major capsid protein [Actinomycetota bacterium]
MSLLQTLEARSAALQAQIQALMPDGQVAPEKREEWHGLLSASNEVDALIGATKDAELVELRSQLEKAGPKAQETEAEKYGNEYRSFLRTGAKIEERAAMSTTDANGGYIVPENLHAPLLDKIRALNPIYKNATLFTLTGGSSSLELPNKATHGAVSNAVEAGARAETTEPTLGNATLTCYDYFVNQYATQLYLDSVAGSESQLLEWIYADIIAQAEVDAVSGNGTTKIKGLFAETAKYGTQLSAVAGALAAADLINLFFKLPAGFRQNGKFMMATATLAAATQLAHPAAADKPLVTQGDDGIFRILGREILETESAPALASAAYPVAFGDIAKAYAVGIHKAPSILRDPYTQTPHIRFYGLARLGGCAWDAQAAVLLKSSVS